MDRLLKLYLDRTMHLHLWVFKQGACIPNANLFREGVFYSPRAHIFYANLAAAHICKKCLYSSYCSHLKANTFLEAAVRSRCHNETRLKRFRSHVQKHVVWFYNYTAIISKLRCAHKGVFLCCLQYPKFNF